MTHWLRNLVILLVLLGIVGAAAAWFTRGSEQTGSFKTQPITRGDIAATIGATGTVEPEEVIDVGAQVAGRITEFGKDKNGKSIDYGSQIEEGMILAQIDPILYQSDLESAKAQFEQAQAGVARAQADLLQFQAKFNQAKRDWDRAQKLGPSDALAQVDYDAYQSAFESAKANVAVGDAAVVQAQKAVAQAQASVDRAVRNLGYCTISSPVKGVIIDRRVNIGQTVVSSLNAPSLFLIAKDLTRMQVWASVNEADIGNIHPGQQVAFTVDAFPNRKFKGTVGKVRLNATMTQNVVTYTVEIVTDNSDGTLLPYLTANANFQIAKHEGVLIVPNAALRWSPSDTEQIAPDARDKYLNKDGAGSGATTEPATRHGNWQGPNSHGSGSSAATGAGSGDNGTTERPSMGQRSHGTIWLADGQFARPVRVRLGVTDGINTEVIADELKEGAQVIVGEAVAGAGGGDDARNPFAPQFRSRRGR